MIEPMFEILNEQSALVAEILSFLMEDTEALANMRTVSKAWNKTVIPYCLNGRRFLKSSASSKYKFVQELVRFGDSAYAGRTYYLDDETSFTFLMDTSGAESDFPWLKTQKMTFIRNYVYSRPDDFFEVPKKEEKYSFLEHDAERFSRYIATLQSTRSWDEFQATAEQAYMEAFFLSVEDQEKAKSEGAKIDLQKGRRSLYLPVILSVEIPMDQYTPIQAGSATIVLLKARLNKVDAPRERTYGRNQDPPILHPFLEFRGLPSIAAKEGDDDSHVYPTFAGYNPVPNNYGKVSCQVPLALHLRDGLDDMLWDLETSYLPTDDLWRKCQEQSVREGVAIADGFVPQNLHDNLMKQIDDFNAIQQIDYHPHSNNIVRDIVHPALYSYVKGVSPLTKTEHEIAALSYDPNIPEGDRVALQARDYWGRFYEASAKYQWLPTYFAIGEDGSCTICEYINNLVPRNNANEALYGSLAELFSQALPLIESVYGYCRVIKEEQYIRMDDDSEISFNDEVPPAAIEEKPVSLRGKEVQVVTKIVDYELGPGETYEGVWHVEGMSHEEIVATAIYFIDRDEEIEGGDILFKRAFHKQEAEFIFSSVDQVRPREVENIIDGGLMPLGTVETRKGRLVVFPNSHVHKVSTLKNISTEGGKKKRRIVVFFLINPERRIVSTREVPMQQEHAGGTMKREDALEHRLELMKERKYTKQDWNVRDIELCEH